MDSSRLTEQQAAVLRDRLQPSEDAATYVVFDLLDQLVHAKEDEAGGLICGNPARSLRPRRK